MIQKLTKAEKLIVVGNKVMLSLAIAQVYSSNRCSLDWVSATVLGSAVLNSDFFKAHDESAADYGATTVGFDRMPDPQTTVHALVVNSVDIQIIRMLNRKLAQITGFKTGVLGGGRNFYKHHETLVNDQGEEIGSVSGGGADQKGTFNIILRGTGCTFAVQGWQQHLYTFLLTLDGKLARLDICFDGFEGDHGGVVAVRQAYLDGEFDYNGRRPTSTKNGSWDAEHSRTYNIGARGSKSFTAYEKSHQYGIMDGQWWRGELRYGSQDRVIPLDALIEPDKYFAGAYPYLAKLIDCTNPETILTKTALLDMTSEAVLKRKLNWFEKIVAPSAVHISKAFGSGIESVMWIDALIQKNAHRDLPRSLRDIPSAALRSAIYKQLSPTPSVPAGLVAI